MSEDIDVGQLSEALNDKADRNLMNVSFDNDTLTHLRHLVCDLDFDNAVNVTATTNDAVSYYTAPLDGVFVGLNYGGGKFAINGTKITSDASTNGERCSLLWFPLNKGDEITYYGGNWGGAGTQKFIPYKRQAGTNIQLLSGLTYMGKYATVADLQEVQAENGEWAFVGNDTDGYNRYFTRPTDETFTSYEWSDGGKDTTLGDYVVDTQLPTAGNNYTWYRLYKSGWVEQGGIVTVNANSQYNGTFVIEFKDTNICFLATDNDSALNGNVYGFQQGCGVSSNSTFYLRTAYDGSVKFSWRAEGMSAQGGNQ